ncbi:uncharacterized protein L203_102453 [Cryptococcus depauperatus CBS 7841]|uniref:Mediator of RNA polymerase II transcription subunit 11 n=1 Tax=Cryptococcus depauperatus CBS 7841 TaxID=1295531 RepID=A0A1E3HIV6_9TREE|nr:hypothetical protein L203_06526 [Cryptococcus depauperatus CBS 7841]
MSSPAESTKDELDLESLDADSLFNALSAVEKAIPDLLLQLKPVLAQLSTPPDDTNVPDEETRGMQARQGVEKYMTLLDKIQFVLRQTVYFLRETRTSPQTLRPPLANLIPTPFASTLPSSGSALASGSTSKGDKAELGLYASRIEAHVLGDMEKALELLREELE